MAENWMIELINKKIKRDNCSIIPTFAELYEYKKIKFNITATCMDSGDQEVFNHEVTPDMLITTAINISFFSLS